jgi:Flp pilus assembly protein TadD
LGSRTEPGEALALSLGLVNEGLNSPSMAINHAMALLLNRRAEEARAVLAALTPDQLGGDARNSWRVAMTDALFQLGRYREASEIGATVDSSVLMPSQETWFRDLLHDARREAVSAGRKP